MEDGGGNSGKSGFRKFGGGRFKHLDLGTTSADTSFYPRTAVTQSINHKKWF